MPTKQSPYVRIPGYDNCIVCHWPLRTDYTAGEKYCMNLTCTKYVPPRPSEPERA